MAGIRDWIMGDMPLKLEHAKETNVTKRRLPTGTKPDRELTGRSAPDIIAQAWDWAIGEQPLKPGKVRASNTATVPEFHDGDRHGKKKGIQTANTVWEWVKGEQPLGPVEKKKPKGIKTAKTKRSDKLATWMRKGKQYGDRTSMQQRSKSPSQRASGMEDLEKFEVSDEQSTDDHYAELDPVSGDAERQPYPHDATTPNSAHSSSMDIADDEDPPPGYSQPPSGRRNVEMESVSDDGD